MDQQLKHWELLKSEAANSYKSSKGTFTYYLMGISIAILGYLITIMSIEDLQIIPFKLSLLMFSLTFIFGIISMGFDIKMKFNDLARISALIAQDQLTFEFYVKKLPKLQSFENTFGIGSIISLFLGLICCFCWKLLVIGVLK